MATFARQTFVLKFRRRGLAQIDAGPRNGGG